MKVSVTICTWNRAPRLADALASLSRLEGIDALDWELIVVNNNCTDATDQVLATFEGALPLRRIFEKSPGLSNARNAALEAFHGDYIVWTDDDVLVDAGWLAAYAGAFRRHPDAAVFGGPIRGCFEAAPPEWLAEGIRHVQDAFGIRDLGPEEALLVPESRQFPFGANYAVRRPEQIAFRYDASIGRSPAQAFLGGEEIGVMAGILESGHTGWWVPSARIEHRIRPEQLDLEYIRKFYTGVGRWMGLADREAGYRTLFGYPAWMLRENGIRQLKYLLARATAPREQTLAELKAACIIRGRLSAAGRRDGATG